MEKNLINLGISPELVKPIVEQHIKAAITEAFGGSEKVIENVIHGILTQKVNESGTISSYSGDNRFNWIDVVLTKTIQEVAKEAIKEEISKSASVIKGVIVEQLRSKEGADKVATAILDCMNDTFKDSWRSNIQIRIGKESN